jgi:cation:H+ antiporter
VQQINAVYRNVHALSRKGKPGSLDKARGVLVLQLGAAFVFVLVASDAFTNAVEWIGARLNLTRSAAGAIVAALGSSLPESIIAIVALLILRDARSQEIGIGAVLGAPFMLGTAVFSLIGLIALLRGDASKSISAPYQPTLFGASLFLGTFALALAASFVVSFAVHAVAAGAVLCAYAIYLRYHLRAQLPEAEPSPPRLRLAPNAVQPPLALVVVQLVIALTVTVVASRWFVVALGQAAIALAFAPFIVSVILSPIATELPEASNVVLWMRRREDSLALANVLGAMMFQTSVTSALAMLVTPWRLGVSAYAAGAVTLLAIGVVIISVALRRRLEPWAFAGCGLLYIAYVAYVAVANSFARTLM